jgi:phospholipid transport system transporter-binding protein
MKLVLPERLTLANAQAVLEQLRTPMIAADAVEVFASPLKQFDTSALAVMLELRREAQLRGLSLHWVQTPEPLVSLAQLYGVEALLGLSHRH